jgi:hypothetical protein
VQHDRVEADNEEERKQITRYEKTDLKQKLQKIFFYFFYMLFNGPTCAWRFFCYNLKGQKVPMKVSFKNSLSLRFFCFLQGADRIQLKSGVDTPEMNQKLEPRSINLRSRVIDKKIFTS